MVMERAITKGSMNPYFFKLWGSGHRPKYLNADVEAKAWDRTISMMEPLISMPHDVVIGWSDENENH